MSNFATRLNQLLVEKNMKQTELVERTGIGKSSISTYLSGEYEPKQQNIYKIAQALNVTINYLMGWEDEPELSHPDLIPLKGRMKKIPMLGEIACGEPIYANREYVLYEEVGEQLDADLCLKAKGDSMIGARIHDGDIVFIKECPEVYNGEIAAVSIDDEVTLKRVHFDKKNNILILSPESPNHSQQIYSGTKLEQVHIIGRAVGFQSTLK